MDADHSGMVEIAALFTVVAVMLVLHACATSIADSEELHDLAVRVHTVRNEYLANLRGEPIEVAEVVDTAGSIAPETSEAEPSPVAEAA